MRYTAGDEHNPIQVCIAGAAGRMGAEVCRALSQAPHYRIMLAIDRERVGENLTAISGCEGATVEIEPKLGAALDRNPCHVLIDFTHPSAAADHALTAIKRQVAPVIGTSGLSSSDLSEIEAACKEHGTPAMVVPNFAVGAVLMMKFAQMAARWLPDAEIVEMHHEGKADAPSSTARRTAELIGSARAHEPLRRTRDLIKVEGVRGGTVQGVPIHSVRLKGLVAHQMILFGGQGETLTLRHDSMDRSSFMEGVKLCVREVWNSKGLVVGMDHLLV